VIAAICWQAAAHSGSMPPWKLFGPGRRARPQYLQLGGLHCTDTLANFEKEYGIRINYDVYDSTEVVEAKLLAGSTGYDVVMHSTRYSARLIPIGVYQSLDRDKLPLWENLDPWVLKVMDGYDPGNRYGMPYMWGSTGYAINVDMVTERMPETAGRGHAVRSRIVAVCRLRCDHTG
jgi:spermidine/putrescine-binding protein